MENWIFTFDRCLLPADCQNPKLKAKAAKYLKQIDNDITALILENDTTGVMFYNLLHGGKSKSAQITLANISGGHMLYALDSSMISGEYFYEGMVTEAINALLSVIKQWPPAGKKTVLVKHKFNMPVCKNADSCIISQ